MMKCREYVFVAQLDVRVRYVFAVTWGDGRANKWVREQSRVKGIWRRNGGVIGRRGHKALAGG